MADIQRLAYRPEEVARALGTSLSTMRRLLDSGELKSFKIRQGRFILAVELARYLAEGEARGLGRRPRSTVAPWPGTGTESTSNTAPGP